MDSSRVKISWMYVKLHWIRWENVSSRLSSKITVSCLNYHHAHSPLLLFFQVTRTRSPSTSSLVSWLDFDAAKDEVTLAPKRINCSSYSVFVDFIANDEWLFFPLVIRSEPRFEDWSQRVAGSLEVTGQCPDCRIRQGSWFRMTRLEEISMKTR